MKKMLIVMLLLTVGVGFAQSKPKKKALIAKATIHSTSLTWNASTTSTVTGYNVYKGTTAGGESSTPINTGLVQSGYVDTNVTPLQTVFYVVKAFDPTSTSPGLSAASNEVSATTPGNGAPNPPTNVTSSAN